MFRRILDLRALGLDVTLVPLEALPEGGAPATLAQNGVRVRSGLREPAAGRLVDELAGTDEGVPAATLVLTSLWLPQRLLDLAVGFDGVLVLDLDDLPSAQRRTARDVFRPAEQPGLDTEVGHLQARETAVLDAASLAICSCSSTLDAVTELSSVRAVVVPPTVVAPEPPVGAGAPSAGGVVLAGRFSDEFATPDEAVLTDVLHAVLARSPSGATPAVLAPEDTVPRLRRPVRGRVEVTTLAGSAQAVAGARVLVDLRTFGLPTTARRAEAAAAGVPFVASPTAVGGDDLGDLAADLVAGDATAQAALVQRLLDDHAHHRRVSRALRDLARRFAPDATRPALARALAGAGLDLAGLDLAGTAAPGMVVAGDGDGTEYRRAPLDGTLADADPRVEDLERAMVPVRLHSRDDSINLQSPLDADQRYRIFSRTHLEAPPGTTPPAGAAAAGICFSVLVPTWNTDPDLLAACLDSVAAQTHGNWELCVVDDGSTETAHLDLLRARAQEDPRIRLRLNPYNQGIALASNDALALATGDWVVLLDHDDLLKPDALAWVAAYVDRCGDYDLWYSDEDKIDLSGRLAMPFLKPDWSPELLMGVNYVCHLLAVRRELMQEVGGFRSGFDGAQDYDLVLRLVERARRVGHIAKPLYSWRMIPGSTALDTGSKPKAHHAGHRALQDALDRRFQPATVQDGHADTTHQVRYAVDTDQLLTIMIPTRDRVDLMRSCIDRLRRASGGVRYELLVVDNQSTDPATLEYLEELLAEGHQVVRYPHDFSFARQVNLGALHARGDLLLILNNDTWARNDDWLLRMMEHAQRPEVGLVGARLMFPEGQRDDRPQHEGIVLGMAGLAYNIDLGGYMGLDQFVRNCSSVTAACVMLRPSVLFAVGGMEERLRVAYNDVDFGVRISEYGYRVVYTPHAVLEHPESASRKDLHPMEDEEWLVGRWGPRGAVREPFVNTHFEWLMPVFYRL